MLALRGWLARASGGLLGVAAAALILIEASQAVLRHGFATGVFWASEIATLLLMLLGWIGAGHLWITRQHLVVDLLGSHLDRWRRPLLLATDCLLFAGLAWLTPRIIVASTAFGGVQSGAVDLPASVRFVPVTAGLILLGIGSTLNLAEAALRAVLPSDR
ncbi:MAG: TRAP transporter small permease subunit [Burkholderiaceae bacterium]